MRRKRQQTGSIFQARGTWYVRYFEDRVVNGVVKHVRIATQIAPVTTRGKRPPKAIEDQALALVGATNVTNATPDRVLTLGDFVEQVYFPHIAQYKRPSTLRAYRDLWKNHFQVRCAPEWLKNVRTFHVQGWLDAEGKGGTLSRNSLKHIKTFISAVFKLARQQGYYLGENPVRDTAISPRAAEPQETYAYNLEEIRSILAVLPETAAAVFAVSAFGGLRRGELQGLALGKLSWRNDSRHSLNLGGSRQRTKNTAQQGRGPSHPAACRAAGHLSPSAWRSAERPDVRQSERKADEPEQPIKPGNPARFEPLLALSQRQGETLGR